MFRIMCEAIEAIILLVEKSFALIRNMFRFKMLRTT